MNMKLFLELIARSNGFRSELNNSGRAVTKFTQGAKREFHELRRMVGSAQGTLAGIGLSVGAVAVAMDSARLDKSLTQIGQTAGASKMEVAALRQDLFRMGRESGQNVDDLKGGFDALVQSGLNMKEAKSTLDGVNVAMAVTGANAQTLSGGLTVAATAFQFDLSKPGQALDLLDKMTVAGRLGNAELQNLSDIFARVGVNANSAGMGFDKTLAFIEGLSKVERNPERLSTLADSTLRVFTNPNYMKQAQKATGIRFFDAKGARRDAFDVLADMKKKYDTLKTDQQRFKFISQAFGKADLDTIKGIKTLLGGSILPQTQEFHKTIAEAGGTLKRDFSEATRNLVDQAGMLKNDLRQAADGFVKPINEALGQFIQFVRAKKENGGLNLDGKEMVGVAGIATAGYFATRYGGKALGRLLRGKGSLVAGVTEGKLLQQAAGVTPVFVTNWPGGSMPGMPGSGNYSVFRTPDYAGKAKGTAGTAAGLLGFGLPGVIAASAIATGGSMWYGAGKYKDYLLRGTNPGMFTQSLMMRPFMGPLTQGMGAWGAYRESKNIQNDIKIDIQIDGQGRIVTSTNGMNNKVNTMKRGSFFDAITSLPPGY